MKVTQIRDRFAEIKRVGCTAEDLANKILDIYTKSRHVTEYFEQKQSEGSDFMQNFYMFGGEEAVNYANNIYVILKEMNRKIEELE